MASKVDPGDTGGEGSDQAFPGDSGDKDIIEELLETSPIKQDRLADELIIISYR